MAVKAYPYPIKVQQPDGSIITITLHGDEFHHYALTPEGMRVVRNDNGFLTRQGTAKTATALHESIRAHNINRLNASGGIPVLSPAVTGQVRILVIPVEFADIRFSVEDPQSHFDAMMNTTGYSGNGGTGSVKDYFAANIPDRDFIFDVCAPVQLSKSYSYYGSNDVSTPSVITYDANLAEMVSEACTLADSEVDFSRYDNDGDGNADYIFLYVAGHNEAESGDDNAIWPQTNNISSKGLRLDGTGIGLFSCSSELSGGNIGSDIIYAGIGTFCHEFSHFLGLVDLYDTDHGNGGVSKCLWGSLSVMDNGNYNNSGRTPPYFCAIDREMAGTARYMDISEGSTVSLDPVNIDGTVIRIPTSTDGEYYLMENRQEYGWDQHIGGSGMVIYHIDKSGTNVDGITASVRWMTNLVNSYAQHECADLVEAFSNAEHISQVFFPGQADIKEFSAAGDPAFIAWDGTPVGLKLINIAENGDNVTFDVMEDNTEILLTPVNCRIKSYQNKAVAEWESGRPGYYRWGIIWGKDGEPLDQAVRDTALINRYTFTGLTPKTEYQCMIYHIGEHHHGDTLCVRFGTSSLTSPFPYIVLDKDKYVTGDTLDLTLNNITEGINSCLWYINGNRALTDRYIFKSAGTYEITAVIEYSSDRSVETVRRRLTVTHALIDRYEKD